MTQQEVNKLLALMKANYSYAFKTMSQQDKYLLLNTWTFTLQDLNGDDCGNAVDFCIEMASYGGRDQREMPEPLLLGSIRRR